MTPGVRLDSAVVVGGAGAVGVMVGDVFRTAGIDVAVVDKAARQPFPGTYMRADITAPDSALKSLLRGAGVIVLAVPEQAALDALPELAGSLSAESVLADTLSVKSRFAEALQASPIECAAVGINPMFAPTLEPNGRPVAAVTYRPGAGVDRVLSAFTESGAAVIPLEADRHDRLTALTQALTHASILSFGLALAEEELDPAELVAVGTPPHMLSLALLARVSGGTPEVYWDVQAGNPYAEQARRGLANAVTALNDVVANGDEARFTRLMERAESALGSESEALRTTCAEVFTQLGRRY
ncbi:MAG: prephenate dehydrogenase [Rhodococcus sp.]|nr:prephenate dehydrogenase [Rhodococcus sp. (in: high G+C Gram-positive bacteria)]